jgi:hypothetical protein
MAFKKLFAAIFIFFLISCTISPLDVSSTQKCLLKIEMSNGVYLLVEGFVLDQTKDYAKIQFGQQIIWVSKKHLEIEGILSEG